MDNQEKDNFWVWIGVVIVLTIVGVFLLKSREMESAAFTDSYSEMKAEESHKMKNK